MKKANTILATKDEVRRARSSLEAKTEQAFADFARARQKAQVMARLKYLD